jgi:hypothetical protein
MDLTEKTTSGQTNGREGIEEWLAKVRPELQPISNRLDQLIMEELPDVVCGIKWNVPFYGVKGKGWITSLNSFKAHVKLIFYDGNLLKPMLPSGKDNSYIDYRSLEEVDEKQVKAWLKQAKKLPGWLKAE